MDNTDGLRGTWSVGMHLDVSRRLSLEITKWGALILKVVVGWDLSGTERKQGVPAQVVPEFYFCFCVKIPE